MKGQITVFIIVGVLVLFIVVGVFFLTSTVITESLSQTKVTANDDTAAIKSFVDNCLKKTLEEGIEAVLLNGGFYTPTMITFYESWKVPYHFYLGDDLHPTSETVKKELESYIYDNLRLCVGDFKLFDGIRVETGSNIPEVTINEKSVTAKVEMPLKISVGDTQTELNTFEAEVKVSLQKVTDVIEGISENQALEPNEVMLEYLTEDSIQNNYKFELHFQNDEVITALIFDEVKLKGQPLQVQYASRYDWFSELDKEIDLQPIGEQFGIVGEEFTYQLNATGTNLTYKSDHKLIHINKDGLITFTPKKEDTGMHYLWVGIGNGTEEDAELMTLMVVEI